MNAKNPQKQGKILEGGGRIFLAGQNIDPWLKYPSNEAHKMSEMLHSLD